MIRINNIKMPVKHTENDLKKTGQGLSEELGKYIWLTKADTSQETPASKNGSSSLLELI